MQKEMWWENFPEIFWATILRFTANKSTMGGVGIPTVPQMMWTDDKDVATIPKMGLAPLAHQSPRFTDGKPN